MKPVHIAFVVASVLIAVVIAAFFLDARGPDVTGEVGELNSFRNEASLRCSGGSYSQALGKSAAGSLGGAATVSKTLLRKGYGTGSLDIGVTLQEKTELSTLLGSLESGQIDRFLSSYQNCMNEEMFAFYRVKGLEYPETPKTESIVWEDKVHTATSTTVAHRTEKSGNWREYDVCVDIPDNGLMLKDSVQTRVASGVGAGSWGDWRKDIRFVDFNAYGPTKVCRGFDHQIHDQDRILEIRVNYKLPKATAP